MILEKCSDCAFTPGTEASNSAVTLVKAHLCALMDERFECHINKGYPCHGWAQATMARAASEKKPSVTQLHIAEMCSELVSECERLALAEDKRVEQERILEGIPTL